MSTNKAMTGKLQVVIPGSLEKSIDRKAKSMNLRKPDFVRLVLSAATSDQLDLRFVYAGSGEK